jgi:hypothetical protein
MSPRPVHPQGDDHLWHHGHGTRADFPVPFFTRRPPPLLSLRLLVRKGGLLYAFGAVPAGPAIGLAKYAVLLGIDVYGLLVCIELYLLPVGMKALTARYP